MSGPSIKGWERTIKPPTIESDVIGDFHEPKGAKRDSGIKAYSPIEG
jgi:hypothetical protein